MRPAFNNTTKLSELEATLLHYLEELVFAFDFDTLYSSHYAHYAQYPDIQSTNLYVKYWLNYAIFTRHYFVKVNVVPLPANIQNPN